MFVSLPLEIIDIIVEYLDLRDRLRLMLTNSLFLNPCRRSIYSNPSAFRIPSSSTTNSTTIHGSRFDRRKRRTNHVHDITTPPSSPASTLMDKSAPGLWPYLLSFLTSRFKKSNPDQLFLYSLKAYHQYPSNSKLRDPLGYFIKHLDMKLCFDMNDYDDDEAFQQIAMECPNLCYLNLSDCWSISDNSVYYISNSPFASKLTCLNLSGCFAVSSEALCTMFENCICLTSINLKSCENVNDNTLRLLSLHCKSLQKIRLQECWRISNVGLKYLACNLGNRITWLDLSHCMAVGDDGLIQVALHCKYLQWLDISKSPLYSTRLNSTSDTISYSVTRHPTSQSSGSQRESIKCPSLLGEESKVTDNSIQILSKNCIDLELLDLSYCSEVTDEGLLSVAKYSEKLKSLSLKGMDRITRASILALGQLRKRTRKLIWLQIFQCSQINSGVIDEMIESLADGWKKGPYSIDVHKEVMDGKSWEDVGI